MSDRQIQEQGEPVQREAQIWPLAVLGPSLWNRLKASLAEKGDQKMKEGVVTGGNGVSAKEAAGERVIRRGVAAASADGSGKGCREA
jgi:hypothetical protein